MAVFALAPDLAGRAERLRQWCERSGRGRRCGCSSPMTRSARRRLVAGYPALRRAADGPRGQAFEAPGCDVAWQGARAWARRARPGTRRPAAGPELARMYAADRGGVLRPNQARTRPTYAPAIRAAADLGEASPDLAPCQQSATILSTRSTGCAPHYRSRSGPPRRGSTSLAAVFRSRPSPPPPNSSQTACSYAFRRTRRPVATSPVIGRHKEREAISKRAKEALALY